MSRNEIKQSFTDALRDEAAAPEDERVNILVVDDLPGNLLVYRSILEELGQNLITASSGEEALKQVLKQEFAVIMLDVSMPDMDGFETASLIRQRKKSARTPIIFLTAFNDEMRMSQGYASGAVDYLPTPVVPEVLQAKVRVFIELSQMRRQAALQAEEHGRRKAAEEADRRKDEFLATLAHELRNPLAPIRSALHILGMQNIPPGASEQARGVIEQQLTHIIRLVDDLMDVARITQGKIDLRKEFITLQDVLASAVETAQLLIDEKHHTLHVDMPATPIHVEGDAVRLSQIFSNLLNNAAKYTEPEGDISLRVWQESGNAVVAVRDNGVGIARDMQNHIFDMFTQVDSSLERSQGGLGIGLTLVRRLVEMHGGGVEVRSEGIGKGSEFIVRLPVRMFRAAPKTSMPLNEALPVSPRHILVVDDNLAVARTLGLALELLGHEVQVAHDGPEALKIARTFQPDLMLLDIGLPGMNGYDLCRALRKEPALQHSVLVAQTGWGQSEHRKRSKEAGFDYHLVKPVDVSMLQQLILSLEKMPARVSA